MAFPVYLSPTTASPPAVQIEANLRGAIAAGGGAIDPDGKTLHLPDGARIQLNATTQDFRVETLSPGFCQVLFTAAQQSNMTVDRAGSDLTPLMMKGSKDVDTGLKSRETISSAADLCLRLQRDLQEWDAFVSDGQKAGTLGSDGQPVGPPGDPGSEVRLSSDQSGVTQHCASSARRFKKLSWRFLQTVVSRNSTYGVVWRADFTTPGFRHIRTRMVCWQALGTDGRRTFVIEDHPLEMSDPKQSLRALEP